MKRKRHSPEQIIAKLREADGLLVGIDLEKDKIGWCSQSYDSGYDVLYTLVRGLLSQLPVGSGSAESCLASALADVRFTDLDDPPANDGYWYLLRGANGCGTGSYGSSSDGDERSGPILESCPTSEAELCWQTGGWWDIGTCGHYLCGVESDCDAIIPGCDCGSQKNFMPGVGCSNDPLCQ